MKTALASKIALCVCPPVLVATSVATVSPVRRTVHRLTAPHHPHAIRHHRPHRFAAAPCAAAPAGGGGPGALRTFASPGPADDVLAPGSGPLSTGGPTLLADLPESAGDYRTPFGPDVATPGGLVAPPVTSGSALTSLPLPLPTPVEGTTPAVPEPLTWLLTFVGIGAMGTALRRGRTVTNGSSQLAGNGDGGASSAGRRRGRLLARLGRAGVVADLVATPLEPLGAAANGVATGAKSTKAALLAKAALCVCPPALLATSVAVVPPVRHAVYAATTPRGLRPAAAPCDPGVAISYPVRGAGRVGAPAAERTDTGLRTSAETPVTPSKTAPPAPATAVTTGPVAAVVAAVPTATVAGSSD